MATLQGETALAQAPPASAETQPDRGSRGLAGTVSRLTLVNAVVVGASLLTGPLQARVLGPTGRGELAAVLVPATLAPVLAEFGLGAFAMREVARGRRVGAVVGSVGVPLLLFGLIGAALAFPVAGALVGSTQPVHDLLVIGLLLLPVGLFGNLLVAVTAGTQDWVRFSRSRLIPPIGGLIGTCALAATGHLTVVTASALTFAVTTLALAPMLPVLTRGRPITFDRKMVRRGMPFGAKAWLGGLVTTANVQIDQLIMVSLVEPRQLGLYAVAVTLAGFSSILTTAVGSVLIPLVASGDGEVVARVLRVTLVLVATSSLVVGALTPIFLPLLFGSAFQAATVMAEILLVAGIARAGASVLTGALTGAGCPGLPAVAEAVTLAATLPALFVVLPWAGGIGAACVTLVGYTLSFALQLLWSSRQFKTPIRSFVLLGPSDIAWARTLIEGVLRRVIATLRRSRPEGVIT